MIDRTPAVRPIAALLLVLSSLTPLTVSGQEAPPTVESLSIDGPYQVATYTELPDTPEFGDATIYFPSDASEPVGGIAIAPGFTEAQRHISWWGPRLASHGYAVLTLDTNEPGDRPDVRAAALMAAVRLLRSENDREESPLFGRVDIQKMAIMGHSMGGGGTLIASNENGSELKASIPFTPWQPEGDFSRTTVPTLVLAGENDGIAGVAAHAWPHFQSIPASTPRAFFEFAGGDHFIADTERGPDLDTVGRLAIAWLKIYVDEDERYRPFIFGSLSDEDEARFSRHLTGP